MPSYRNVDSEHTDLSIDPTDELWAAERRCHLLLVVCTDPTRRADYAARLDHIRRELARRGARA